MLALRVHRQQALSRIARCGIIRAPTSDVSSTLIRTYSSNSGQALNFSNSTARKCSSESSGVEPSHVFDRAVDDQFGQRQRLSRLWLTSGGIAEAENEDAHARLVRAGFLRQAHSGIFHLLPLGLRIHNKLERLIDKHMTRLGASKVKLSSISSQQLWTESKRLEKARSELFLFRDRKDVGLLLSPTHEEEITKLVASTVKSYKEFPIRLYQTSRKYRDELRPRHGLLRSREFMMKDLYTFDYSKQLALSSYYEVCAAYRALFDELKVPYLVAEADSGNIGGDLSHEFHFPSAAGEDHIVSCDNCNYVANEERAESLLRPFNADSGTEWAPQRLSETKSWSNSLSTKFGIWHAVSRDRSTLINVWTPSGPPSEVNTHTVKNIVPELDASIKGQDAVNLWAALDAPQDAEARVNSPRRMINLVDGRLSSGFADTLQSSETLPVAAGNMKIPQHVLQTVVTHHPSTGLPLNLLQVQDGDGCPRCTRGTLSLQRAIELGHTFYLGTRYSEPLGATVAPPRDKSDNMLPIDEVALQMCCHGIGVSRIVGTVAEVLQDEAGLNWPRVLAPFEIVIIPARGQENSIPAVYDVLENSRNPLDVVLDDRNRPFAWKMKDADLVGYPIIVVVGRKWHAQKMCEVQCRQLAIHEDVAVDVLSTFVTSLLEKL